MPESGPGGDPALDAPLLAQALVALNRQGELLAGLGNLFESAGHQLYLVGGSVRDALLGRLSPDLDFTTDARPDAIQRIVRPWADALWDTGIEFGTVGAARDGRRVEITTFRADSYDQVSRNPEVRFGDRLEDDLIRRDFTVNAMAVRITAEGPGEFLDPLGGLAALRDGVLDTPSPPEVSFGDDPLRMLRAARFIAGYGLEPDADVAAVKLVIPELPVPAPSRAAVKELSSQLTARLDDGDRGELKRAVNAFEAAGRRADIAGWVAAVERCAARAGLLLCGDLEVASGALQSEPLGLVGPEEKLADLMAFTVSDEHHALREEMGVAIQP